MYQTWFLPKSSAGMLYNSNQQKMNWPVLYFCNILYVKSNAPIKT